MKLFEARVTVEVPVGQRKYADPYIVGRNGYYPITALRIDQWGQDDPQGDGAVNVEGIGKRGKPIRGGFRCLMVEDIDALCKAWIEARGGLVIMPGDEGVSGLVTVCCGVPDDSVVLGRDSDALQRIGEEYVGDIDPEKMEYHLAAVELLAAPQQRSEEQAL
ncbi:MAG TPA: hypothetical protein VMX14_03655 [Anaerolineae bacterium]|nr:hypothetical protein [Anaerolineae bacterium]HUW13370.1 hypothetical protein [Anaerolineae bacterium]